MPAQPLSDIPLAGAATFIWEVPTGVALVTCAVVEGPALSVWMVVVRSVETPEYASATLPYIVCVAVSVQADCAVKPHDGGVPLPVQSPPWPVAAPACSVSASLSASAAPLAVTVTVPAFMQAGEADIEVSVGTLFSVVQVNWPEAEPVLANASRYCTV